MDKKEIVDVLGIILDGLTAGESSERKLEETRKFYESELAKVNTENQFYQRVIRFCLLEKYVNLWEFSRETFQQPDGNKLFRHQSEFNNQVLPQPVFSQEEFSTFVDQYLAAARNDKVIGIKE